MSCFWAGVKTPRMTSTWMDGMTDLLWLWSPLLGDRDPERVVPRPLTASPGPAISGPSDPWPERARGPVWPRPWRAPSQGVSVASSSRGEVPV
ncbi:MAG: hypothetical protein JWP82_2121 [Humibacillus sp.]|nr:hypothetical protein [Humibacillus sp.]